MNKYWIQIVTAAVFEVCWVIGLKHSDTALKWGLTLFAIFVSFYLLIKATQHLPVGTAYAVFVGLGTTGTVVMDTVLFNAPISFMKILFIVILLCGVVGLKMLTDHGDQQEEAN